MADAPEGQAIVTSVDTATRTIQRKIQDLEVVVGATRRAAIIGRLSNTGSSQDGAVYSNRVQFYMNKV